MVTEDYVNFEVAKLLKDKGFDEALYSYYKDGIFTITDLLCKYEFDVDLCRWGDNEYAAPTLQMAMKWLREVHKYLIVIGNKNGNYLYLVKDLKANTDFGISSDEYINYEQTCEEAIKYCLENLI